MTASPKEIAETLALRGFEVASSNVAEACCRRGRSDRRDDAVIDFEVTANRPDCLSVIGFAREIATAYDLPLRGTGRVAPVRSAPTRVAVTSCAATPPSAGGSSVTLEDAELCPRYAAAVVDSQRRPRRRPG